MTGLDVILVAACNHHPLVKYWYNYLTFWPEQELQSYQNQYQYVPAKFNSVGITTIQDRLMELEPFLNPQYLFISMCITQFFLGLININLIVIKAILDLF